MIVIVGAEPDFSHTLAEQVVRELEMPCECVATEQDMEKLEAGTIGAVVSCEPLAGGTYPSLVVTPPVRIREVLEGIAGLISTGTGDTVKIGDLEFSAQRKQLQLAGGHRQVKLTDKEAQLLLSLSQSGEEGMDKETLLKNIWGFEANLNTHTLETHIYRLRTKCKELCGNELVAATETGYRLQP